MKFEHYANPMVHPKTGETISSYKKLMHDPATAEVWQTASGKDFGGMCQGDNKTGQKGTNAMFVITHDDIAHALRAKRVFTYGNSVVNHRPKKEDPNRIRITAGGNLIKCEEEISVRTADINTEKLHWNSVISTNGARYMCLDIGNFYLTAALEYFEYMRYASRVIPGMDHRTVQLDRTCIKRICTSRNETGCMGPATSRNTHKQKAPAEISALWIL